MYKLSNATLSLHIPQIKLATINKTQVEAKNLAFAVTDRSSVSKRQIPKKEEESCEPSPIPYTGMNVTIAALMHVINVRTRVGQREGANK